MKRSRGWVGGALFGSVVAVGYLVACGGGDDSSPGDGTSDAGNQNGDGSPTIVDAAPPGDAGAPDTGPPACAFDGGDPTLLNGVVQIAVGTIGACALRRDQSIVCWGESSGVGYLGRGSGNDGYTPASPTFPSDAGTLHFVSVGAGNGNMCALDTDGHVWCWGSGTGGENGTGAPGTVLVPTLVVDRNGAPITNVVALGTARHSSCAMKNDGKFWCWGTNGEGELTGSDAGASAPFAIETPMPDLGTTGVTIGSSPFAQYVCASSSKGTACRGNNAQLQLADPTAAHSYNPDVGSSLVDAGVGQPISELATSDYATCVVDATQQVWCWGQGQSGVFLGGAPDNTAIAVPAKIPVSGPTSRIAISGALACNVDTSGVTRCWGSSNFGDLGNGSLDASASATPTSVVGVGGTGTLPPAKDVQIGDFVCAIVNPSCGAGEVACWGFNIPGAFGYDAGSAAGVPVPALIPAPNPDGGF